MPRTKEQFEEIRNKTKSRILESALKLFAQKGIKGTSIAQIAKEAGVSKGLAYNYFESKEHIAAEVLNALNDLLEEFYSELAEISEPKQQLKKMLELTFGLIVSNSEYWRLFTAFALNPEVIPLAQEKMGQFLEATIPFLETIFAQLKYKNPTSEARVFGALLDGVCFHYLINPASYPLKEVKKLLVEKYC